MLSDKRFTYYQPLAYYDDSTNINYGALPEELFSFQAFPTKDMCEEWLRSHNYNPSDFCIFEYQDDDIENVTLIDHNGDMLPKIEELEDDDLEKLIIDKVVLLNGSVENLFIRRSWESDQQWEDRLRETAHDEVMNAIDSIERSDEFDFSAYCGDGEQRGTTVFERMSSVGCAASLQEMRNGD